MDPITTGIGGALLGKALPADKRGPHGALTVTLASVFPDVDVFADPFVTEPLGDLAAHRGFTHSLAGLVLFAPLLALLVWRFGKDKNYPRLVALAALGLVWHLFTDLATSYGTQIYAPFSYHRAAWDWIFIIDLAFTAILLLPQAVAWAYWQPAGTQRRGALVWVFLAAFTAWVISVVAPLYRVGFRWDLLALVGALLAAVFLLPGVKAWGFRQPRERFCRAGVAVLVAYVALCAGCHWLAAEKVEEFVAARGFTPRSAAALPQPLSPFRWSGLVLTDEGVYQSWFSLLGGSNPKFEFHPSARNRYVERAERLKSARTYLWFARFPVARYREAGGLHVVEWTDRRFVSFRERNSPFVFRVVLNERGEVVEQGFLDD